MQICMVVPAVPHSLAAAQPFGGLKQQCAGKALPQRSGLER
jgi:hypothetical protein